jgi:Uma2 family endonuclease
MYDLPSDNPEDPGLPDEFHDWQPQLLSETFVPATYPPERVLTAKDLNLYFDSQRPGLYGVVGVPRVVDEGKGRRSYVFWQEGRAPTVGVELLSRNTQESDQGLTPRGKETPTKWEVYETILRVPYYVVFDGAGDTLRFFQLQGESYKELSEPKLWVEGLQIGLGLWKGHSLARSAFGCAGMTLKGIGYPRMLNGLRRLKKKLLKNGNGPTENNRSGSRLNNEHQWQNSRDNRHSSKQKRNDNEPSAWPRCYGTEASTQIIAEGAPRL